MHFNNIFYVVHTQETKTFLFHLYVTDIYTTIGEPSSKFDEFLDVRSQFDSDHGVNFLYAYMLPIRDLCATAFCILLYFVFYEEKKIMRHFVTDTAMLKLRD